MSLTFIMFIFEKFLLYALKEQEAQIFEQQVLKDEKLFNYVEESHNDIRTLKHDLANQLTNIYHLTKYGHYNELKTYVGAYIKEAFNAITADITGLPSIDAIISVKKVIAIRKKIKISIDVKAFETVSLHINPVHLNVVLSNAFDNAIEACEHIEDEPNRFINIIMELNENFFILYIFNSSPSVDFKGGNFLPQTIKENKSQHGYGLPNIKRMVEKYNGTMDIQYKNGIFHLKIIIQNVIYY